MKKTHFGQHDNCFGCHAQSIQLVPSTTFKPHFNHTVGAYVNTEREMKSLLRQRSDENTQATGTDHNYQYLDPSELRAMEPKTETEAINDQGRAMEKAGIWQPSTTTVMA